MGVVAGTGWKSGVCACCVHCVVEQLLYLSQDLQLVQVFELFGMFHSLMRENVRLILRIEH